MNKVFWYDYYSVFHYNFLPVLLLIWVIILSVNRFHDSNKSGYLIFAPLINLYWLFASGDANENRFGLPKNNNSKVVYFDELNKEEGKYKLKLVVLSLFLIIGISVNYLLIKNNNDSKKLNQLFTIEDLITNPIDSITFDPLSKIKFNPLEWGYINGNVKFLKITENNNDYYLVFDKKTNLIRTINNNERVFYYYTSNVLDSIHRQSSLDISKTFFYYKKIKDTTIVEEKEFLNNKLAFKAKLSKFKNLVIVKNIFLRDTLKPQVSVWNYSYNNFNQMYESSNKNYGDKNNYEYDLHNNLNYYYENENLFAKFVYNNNLLKSIEIKIQSDFEENKSEYAKLLYKYNDSYPDLIIESSLTNRIKENHQDFKLVLNNKHDFISDYDILYKKDYKNNVCEIKPPKIFQKFTKNDLEND
jgi:uncharacterized membrane protein YhaH (DUF805 family)